jgi:hypothetical protein
MTDAEYKRLIKRSTSYEWQLEEHDEHGDTEDTRQHDTYAQAVADGKDCQAFEICLVRSQGSEDKGVTDRQYAYVIDGELGPMDYDAQIPKRFIEEVRSFYLRK